MLVEESWRAPRIYDSVLSIGSQCLTSTLLEVTGLKRNSGPFDWIFSNLRMASDCIEDDFDTFLDRRYLKLLPAERRHDAGMGFADHEYYRRRYGIATMFNHHDPTTTDGYAYFERCVGRFREALTSGKPHLLLAIGQRHQGGAYGFGRLCDALERYPSIDLLVLISPETRAAQGIELWEERGRHRLAWLHTPSQISGIQFEAHADNVFAADLLREMIVLDG